jgi:hypothetical protein
VRPRTIIEDPSTSGSASITAPGLESTSSAPIALNISNHNIISSPSAPTSNLAEPLVNEMAPPAPPKPTSPVPVVERDAPTPITGPMAPVPVAERSTPVPMVERSAPAPVAKSMAPVPTVERGAPAPSQSPGFPSNVTNPLLPGSPHAADPVTTGNGSSKSVPGSAIAGKPTGKGSKRKVSPSMKPVAIGTRRSTRGKRDLANVEDANANANTNANADVDDDADAEPGDGKGHGPPTKKRRMGA